MSAYRFHARVNGLKVGREGTMQRNAPRSVDLTPCCQPCLHSVRNRDKDTKTLMGEHFCLWPMHEHRALFTFGNRILSTAFQPLMLRHCDKMANSVYMYMVSFCCPDLL